jgi:hypothetical protein
VGVGKNGTFLRSLKDDNLSDSCRRVEVPRHRLDSGSALPVSTPAQLDFWGKSPNGKMTAAGICPLVRTHVAMGSHQ